MNETVAMFGPSISDPTKIVNRDVPVCDLQAYKAAGYQIGSIPESAGRMNDPAGVKHIPNPVSLPDEIYIPDAGFDANGNPVPTVTYTQADAVAQNNGVDVSAKAKTKGKK